MVLGLVMTTVISVLAIVNPHISGLIVDDVIKGGNYDELPYLAAILIGVTAVRSVLRFFYQVVFETCSQGVLYEMRDTVYRKNHYNCKNKKQNILIYCIYNIGNKMPYGIHVTGLS